ncbi:MAG: glycosyltransferase family 2 protein [Desulfobacterales bacterium]|nr:glycosyltransferase family 2 protein [Desulfobacterales bacterium]
MIKKCIIIPAFNEEKNISNVISSIKKYCEDDIVVIDDGSKDMTKQKAKEADAIVISHPFNMGYGVALQTGYKYAIENQYDFLVQIDGDGQHDPYYIPILFSEVQSSACDISIGSRFLNSPYDPGILKKIAIQLFRNIVWITNRQKITDPTSGYQCLNKKIFKFFTEDIFPCDYPDANIIVLLHRKGFKIKEIPVKMTPNTEGRSMHKGIFKILYYFFKVFLSIFIALISEKNIVKIK